MAISGDIPMFEMVLLLSDISTCISFLRKNRLIKTSAICVRCEKAMYFEPAPACADKERWKCKQCQTSRTIRYSSIFQVIIHTIDLK